MIFVCPKYAIYAYPRAHQTSVYLYAKNIQYIHTLGPLNGCIISIYPKYPIYAYPRALETSVYLYAKKCPIYTLGPLNG
jgi:hypothetical protein